MADTSPPPSPPPPPTTFNNPDPTQYWCYHCNKRVPVETLPDLPDIICFECKNGFVESISVSSHAPQQVIDEDQTPDFGNEFLHILRLIALAAREDDEPPPPPPERPADDNDYLRIELDGWRNRNVNHELDEDENEDEHDLDLVDRLRARANVDNDNEETDNRNEDEEEEEDDDNDDDVVRREQRDALRLRLREFANRAATRRNRILDWAEILIGLEDQSMDGYVGNPGDYVDAAGYEALLQTLAESDGNGRRGAPPAAKSAVEGLRTVEVKSSDSETCAICKDSVYNNEGKVVKELECGHVYHGECIVLWLNSKNSCPVCRFELPTDDPEYEEDRRKRLMTLTAAAVDRGCSSSSRGGG